MKSKGRILPLIFISAILSACEDNDAVSGKQKLLKIENVCNQDHFEYEGELLVGFTRSFGPLLAVIGKCFYKGDQLIRIESASDNGVTRTIELEYGEHGLLNKEIITVDVESPDYKNHYVETSYYEYDENARLRARIQTQDIDGYSPYKTEYEWSMGNIVKMSYGIINQQGNLLPLGNKVFTYDRGRNYTNHNIAFLYTNFLAIEVVLSKNNLISISEDSFYDDQDMLIQTTNDFMYNSFGYPIQNQVTSQFIIGTLVDNLTYE